MKNWFYKRQSEANVLWNGKYYCPILLAVAAIGLALHLNMAMMFLFLAVCIYFLVFSDDLMSIVMPLYLIFLMASTYFKDMTVLLKYAPFAIAPFALAIVFNLICYRKPFVKGIMLWPLTAVSVALIIGGAGVIPWSEYLLPINFYYVLGLGAFMIFIYCLALSRLQNKREYDRVERLCRILCYVGVAAVFTVMVFCFDHLQEILKNRTLLFYKPRNFISSVLLMSMPAACYYTIRNKWNVFCILFMYGGMLLTGSRSGLLFGTVLLCACVLYVFTRRQSFGKRINLVFLGIFVIIGAFFVRYIPDLYAARFANGGLISTDETRVKFIVLGIQDFLSHPILGIGLSNQKNIGIFPGFFPGCLVYYHNIVIQVPASMGIVGVAAFGWQFIERIKLAVKTRKTDFFAFALSYIGIVMMSLTNPGVLCPFPETALLVLMFAMMEHHLKSEREQR